MYKLCPVQCLAHGKYMFMIAIISFVFFFFGSYFLKKKKSVMKLMFRFGNRLIFESVAYHLIA